MPGALVIGSALWIAGASNPIPRNEEEQSVISQARGSSRPAPPNVEPVMHNGVRYEQDMQSARYGGTQTGGYLVAVDAATG